MTPPIGEVISPTGARIVPAPAKTAPHRTAYVVVADGYLAQLDAIKAQAERAAASRAAYLFAPIGETK